jgi:hypothetical protein
MRKCEAQVKFSRSYFLQPSDTAVNLACVLVRFVLFPRRSSEFADSREGHVVMIGVFQRWTGVRMPALVRLSLASEI